MVVEELVEVGVDEDVVVILPEPVVMVWVWVAEDVLLLPTTESVVLVTVFETVPPVKSGAKVGAGRAVAGLTNAASPQGVGAPPGCVELGAGSR